MTSRTLGNGYTITVYEHRNSYGDIRFRYRVIHPSGHEVAGDSSFLTAAAADREGEQAAKRAASPLYREPGSTTAGEW